MKYLSLTQPWATLVAIGAKSIETRSWSTSYRGLVGIHAAKGFPPDCRRLCSEEPFRTALLSGGYDHWDQLPLSAVLATVRLVEVRATPSFAKGVFLTAQERAFGDYSPGRYGFILSLVERLATPVPARGALGLWEWSERNEMVGQEIGEKK